MKPIKSVLTQHSRLHSSHFIACPRSNFNQSLFHNQRVHRYSSQSQSTNFITTPCGLRIQTNLPRPFKKILIANRGEIACRIIRTCREIGVQTVAIYSDADVDSLFVRMADESHRVGPPKSSESYLSSVRCGDALFYPHSLCARIMKDVERPGLSREMRTAMGDSAVAAALAVKYVGAGTVEFLVDPSSMEYWFMEMNTRLQVEHPVTEMIVGRDLVQWQLHVAAGHELPCSQTDIGLHGHAIEARIYAEEWNPNLGKFTASSGTLHRLRFPTMHNKGGRNVRVESGVFEGGAVSTHYDAMIAKVIAHVDGDATKNDRESQRIRNEALQSMGHCLENFEVSGLQTNIEFLKRVLEHNVFIDGAVTTDYIPVHREHLFSVKRDAMELQRATAFASLGYLLASNSIRDQTLIGHRAEGEKVRLYDLKETENEDGEYCNVVRRGRNGPNSWEIWSEESDCKMMIENASITAEAEDDGNYRLRVTMDSEVVECDLNLFENKVTVFCGGKRFDFVHSPQLHLKFGAEFVKGKGGIVIAPEPDEDAPVIVHRAPMQSKVYELKVSIGDTVTKGQLMGSVESMKQLYEVWAECDGVVADIMVSVEESIVEEQPLMKVIRDGSNVELKAI